MHKRTPVIVFFATALLGIGTLPAINLADGLTSGASWRHIRQNAFNLDVVQSAAAQALAPLGISARASDVIIGDDQWLFLGDGHDRTVTAARTGVTEKTRAAALEIAGSLVQWSTYAKAHGTRSFRYAIAPNKSSFHPERTPRWFKVANPPPTAPLLAALPGSIRIDVRTPLNAARNPGGPPLYYRDDTHWNMTGATVGFRALRDAIAKDLPELKWLPDDKLAAEPPRERQYGDLSRMLRLGTDRQEDVPTARFRFIDIPVVMRDLDSGELRHDGGNAMIDANGIEKPLLVTSPKALNRTRVLWIRDSFGNAQTPLFALHFSHTIQYHWAKAFASAQSLARLIDEHRPEIIVVTVVERSALAKVFTTRPPEQ